MWLEFPFSEAYLTALEEVAVSGERLDDKLDDKLDDRLDDRLDDKLDDRLGERRAMILRAMAQRQTISVTELAALIGISRNAANKNIQFLKDNGWVKRIGSAKGGHWEVVKVINK